jgi:membrane glycosyltransferase
VPIALLTAWPRFGAWLARIGLWRIPEEVDPPPLIRALGLPAVHRGGGRVTASEQVAAESIGGD